MTSRPRYTLIATGIVAFIILTPFFYIFVRGLKYDSVNHRFVKTGTLSIKTSPTGAKLLLNGKDAGTTNANVRFLIPGDYDVQVTKEDYLPWTKRLNIREQYVTWANPNLPSVTLFYAQPVKSLIEKNISNFFAGKSKVLAIKNDQLLIYDVGSENSPRIIALPKSFPNLEITPSKNEDYFLISNGEYTAVVDIGSTKLVDITNLLNKQAAFTSTSEFQASEDRLKFSDNADLFQLKSGTVYKISWREDKKDILLDEVLAFHPNSAGVYYIALRTDSSGIHRRLMKSQNNAQPAILIDELPAFRSADLFLTDRNQLFILGDDAFYDLSNGVNKISDYVQTVSIDNDNKKLLYGSGNEINIYDLNTGATSLITRSSQSITNPVVSNTWGWVFFNSDNRLQSIEVDNRDHQNNYTFAGIDPNAKFFLNEKSKTIYLLNKGDLLKLQIR